MLSQIGLWYRNLYYKYEFWKTKVSWKMMLDALLVTISHRHPHLFIIEDENNRESLRKTLKFHQKRKWKEWQIAVLNQSPTVALWNLKTQDFWRFASFWLNDPSVAVEGHYCEVTSNFSAQLHWFRNIIQDIFLCLFSEYMWMWGVVSSIGLVVYLAAVLWLHMGQLRKSCWSCIYHNHQEFICLTVRMTPFFLGGPGFHVFLLESRP